MGLPGSGKTTLANELAPSLNAKRLNADAVRKEANDWDFSVEGRKRQAKRMADLAKKLNILHKQLDNYNLKYNFRPNDKSYKLFTNKEFIIIKKQLLKIKHKDKIDTIIDKNIS